MLVEPRKGFGVTPVTAVAGQVVGPDAVRLQSPKRAGIGGHLLCCQAFGRKEAEQSDSEHQRVLECDPVLSHGVV